MTRDARSLGDETHKPFLKDLYNLALENASPHDWILYTNTDCAIDQDLYQHLRSLDVTAVEYMRLDVEGNPSTLDELFTNDKKNYSIGVDGLAVRAGFWAEISDHLPDFVIGEPHWDTTYSGILRRIIPVCRDKQRLYHPKHDQVWDLREPTSGGKHNHNLYYDAVAYGHSSISCIQDESDVTDTAVICTSFGNDPIRIKANIEGISKQLKQDLYCDYCLIEAVSEAGESAYPESLRSRLNYIPVPASSRSQDLFQKESLMNYGWRASLKKHQYEYFIFTDADIYSSQLDWFRQMRTKLQENPSRAVQGFRMVRDTIDPQLHYSSLASAYVLNHQTDLTLNPGLCWAFNRRILEMGDGFNADCIECAGDSALVAEYLNWDTFQYDPFLYQFRWFGEIERELSFRVELDCVPIDIMHVHHGYLKERNYDGVRYAIDGLPPLRNLVERDENGLLCWKNSDCPERELMQHRQRMSSREEVDSLFEEFGYARFKRTGELKKRERKTKPVFEFPDDKNRVSVKLPEQPGKHGQADSSVLNIFNPVEVFRLDFPFSWCEGVKTLDESTFIPISAQHNPTSLILEGTNKADYIIGVLPIQPSWEPFDLTDYATLNLTVQVSKEMTTDVTIQLESQAADDVMINSNSISLVDEGLKAGDVQVFSFPLSRFVNDEGFQIERSRLLKIYGGNSFRMELARIFIA